jgi:hypothetical protein
MATFPAEVALAEVSLPNGQVCFLHGFAKSLNAPNTNRQVRSTRNEGDVRVAKLY